MYQMKNRLIQGRYIGFTDCPDRGRNYRGNTKLGYPPPLILSGTAERCPIAAVIGEEREGQGA
jgi:hypothetical protein